MSAIHPANSVIDQKTTKDKTRSQFYELSKTHNFVNPVIPSSYSMIAGGINQGAGTTFPIVNPIETITPASSIDIDLSRLTGHYQKISITSDDTTINFENTIRGRAMTFTLDITINTATFNSITYNPTFENPPTGLPTTNGSRYLLVVSVIKTDSEEKYFVVNGFGTGGGGSSVPPGTAENQHLEWNNTSLSWEARTNLEFGATGPHADAGFLRFANNSLLLSARSAANNGNMELKLDSNNTIDWTMEVDGDPVKWQLRSQHATNPDAVFSIQQNPDDGTTSFITAVTFPAGRLIVYRDSADVITINDTYIQLNEHVDMAGHQIDNPNAIVFEGFTGNGRSISEFATGVHYDIENIAHAHVFRVGGATPATVLTINDDNVTLAQDIVAAGAAKGMSNIGQLTFVNNTATPVSTFAIFSDGTDLFANTGSATRNLDEMVVTSVSNTFTAVQTFNENIVAPGATKEINNIGVLNFIDNTASPIGLTVGIWSDGTDMFVATGGVSRNLSDIGDGVFKDSEFRITGSSDLTKKLAFEVDGLTTATTRTVTIPDGSGKIFYQTAFEKLDMNNKEIENVTFIDFGTPNSTLNHVVGAGNGFRFDTPTNEFYELQYGSVAQYIFKQNVFDGTGNTLEDWAGIVFSTGDSIINNPTVMTFGKSAADDSFLFELSGNDELTIGQTIIDVHGNRIDNIDALQFTGPTEYINHIDATGFKFELPTAETYSFEFNTTEKLTISNGTTTVKNVFVANGTVVTLDGSTSTSIISPLIIIGDTDTAKTNFFGYMEIEDRSPTGLATPSDATSVNLFLNSSTGELSVKKSTGSIVSLEGGGGSQSPWTVNVDADNKYLFDLKYLQFFDSDTIPSNTEAWIMYDTTLNGMVFNIPEKTPSGTYEYGLRINSTEEFVFDDSQLDLKGNKLTSIGTATITDLVEESTPTTGDFLLAYEATSGAMKKVDIGNLPSSGATNKIEQGDSKVEVIDAGSGVINFDVDGSNRAALVAGNMSLGANVDFAIQTTGNLLLDGAAGNCYLDSSGTNVRIVANGQESLVVTDGTLTVGPTSLANEGGHITMKGQGANKDFQFDNIASTARLWWNETGDYTFSVVNEGTGKANISLEAGGKFFLDGGGDTYFLESSANNLELFVGATKILEIDTKFRVTAEMTIDDDIKIFDQQTLVAQSGFIGISVAPTVFTTLSHANNVGALKIPYKSSSSDPTGDSDLDNTFGNANGCIGLWYNSTAGSTIMYARANGTWQHETFA